MERTLFVVCLAIFATSILNADIHVEIEKESRKNIEVIKKQYFRGEEKVLVTNVRRVKKTGIRERTGQVFFHKGEPIFMFLTGNDQVTRSYMGTEGINVSERDFNGDRLPDIITIESDKGRILNLFVGEKGDYLMEPVEAEKKTIDGKTVRDYRRHYISLLPDFDSENKNVSDKKEENEVIIEVETGNSKKESANSISVDEKALFAKFRQAEPDERAEIGKEVSETLHLLRTRLKGDARISLTRNRVEQYLGKPERTEKKGGETRLIYQVNKVGGQKKYLVLVFHHDFFMGSEPMWSIE